MGVARRAVGTTATASGVNTITVTYPTNLPDDILILTLSHQSQTATTPAGWTLIGTNTIDSSCRLTTYWARVTTPISGTVVVTFSGTTQTRANIISYSGVRNSGNPYSNFLNGGTSTSTTTCPIGPMNATANSAGELFLVVAAGSSSSRTWSAEALSGPTGVSGTEALDSSGTPSLMIWTATATGTPSTTTATTFSATANSTGTKPAQMFDLVPANPAVADSNIVFTSGAVASFASTVPSVPYPANAVNDILILAVSETSVMTGTPAGWTLLDSSVSPTSSRTYVYWLRVTTPLTGSMTLNEAAGTGFAQITAVTNIRTAGNPHSTSAINGSSTAVNNPSTGPISMASRAGSTTVVGMWVLGLSASRTLTTSMFSGINSAVNTEMAESAGTPSLVVVATQGNAGSAGATVSSIAGGVTSATTGYNSIFFDLVPAVPIKTVYVSSAGSDSNSGLTAALAVATVSKVNTMTLNPGDTVAFRGGDTFTDNLLYLTASGTSGQPITITSYGTGRATIAPTGGNNGIYAYNCGWITVDNLNFSSSSSGSGGVQFFADNGASYGQIRVTNFDVVGFNDGVVIGTSGAATRYVNPYVDSGTAHGCRDHGIVTYGPAFDGTNFGLTGLTLTNCAAYSNLGNNANTASASGFGIVLGSVDNSGGGNVSSNVVYGNGSLNACIAIGPVGFMVYNSKGVVVSASVAYSNRTGTTADGEGFDLDINVSGCVIERCLSYDNDGAGILLFGSSSNSNWATNTARFNVCWGNGRKTTAGTYWGEIKVAGITASALIYNNLLIARDTSGTQPRALSIEGSPSSLYAVNNVLYGHSGPQVETASAYPSANVKLYGNDYWSTAGTMAVKWGATTYTTLAALRAGASGQEFTIVNTGLSVDPLIPAPAVMPSATSAATRITGSTGLLLPSNSPVLDAGLDILATFGVNPGTQDFYGNTLSAPFSAGALDIAFAALSLGSFFFF